LIVSTAIFSMTIFVGGLWVFGVVRIGTNVLHTARHAMAIVRDVTIEDAAREKAAQRASLQLFRAFASILFRSAVAFLASFIPILLADTAGLARTQDVFEFLLRWDVIFIAALFFTVGYMGLQRICPLR
jgi:hypothetical protein